MLWQHAFLETSWRFFAGLILLTVTALWVVTQYPNAAALAQAAPAFRDAGALGREIAEAAALSATYDGYVWSSWFRNNASMFGAFFAAIIGTGGLLTQTSGARLFTLSLPVSRERLITARAAAGLLQVFILTAMPAVVIVLISPVVGERFSPIDSAAYALCLFAGVAVFFSIAFFTSTIVANMWAPVIAAMCAGPLLRALDRLAAGQPSLSLLQMMHGESYFAGRGLPWPMLLVSVVLTSTLLYAGTRIIARRDF
jgi:hypothetical protein